MCLCTQHPLRDLFKKHYSACVEFYPSTMSPSVVVYESPLEDNNASTDTFAAITETLSLVSKTFIPDCRQTKSDLLSYCQWLVSLRN